MALLLMTGLDNEITGLNDNNRGQWENVSGQPYFQPGGRYSGGSVEGWSNNFGALVLPSSPGTLIVGCSLNIRDAAYFNAAAFLFRSGSTDIATLRFDAGSAEITWHEGRLGTQRQQISAVLPSAEYFWLCFKIVWHATAGSIEVEIDGNPAWSITGIPTLFTGSNPNKVGFFHNSSVGTSPDWDDIFICDDTGSDWNAIFGEQRIVTLRPSSDVSVDPAWTASTGSTFYTLIDEAQLGASDYMTTATFNAPARFGLSDTAVDGVFTAVRPVIAGLADAAHVVQTTVHCDGNDFDETMTWASDGINYLRGVPTGVEAEGWTLSDVNAMEVSVEVLS